MIIFVVCQITCPHFCYFFLQVWLIFNILCMCKIIIKIGLFSFFFLPKLYHLNSIQIQIQNGWCLTTLKVSKAPLGLAFLSLSVHLGDDLLDSPLIKKSFFPLKKKNVQTERCEAGKERGKKPKDWKEREMVAERRWLAPGVRSHRWARLPSASAGVLEDKAWRSLCMCVCACVFGCVTLSVSIKTHL